MACPREVTFFVDIYLCTPPLCTFNFWYANPICFLSFSLVVFCKNQNACLYLNVIDPDYQKQARDIIDELAAEVHQVCDMVWVERNDPHFIQDEDGDINMKVQMELHVWEGRFTSSLVLNQLLITWMAWNWTFWRPLLLVWFSSSAQWLC